MMFFLHNFYSQLWLKCFGHLWNSAVQRTYQFSLPFPSLPSPPLITRHNISKTKFKQTPMSIMTDLLDIVQRILVKESNQKILEWMLILIMLKEIVCMGHLKQPSRTMSVQLRSISAQGSVPPQYQGPSLTWEATTRQHKPPPDCFCRRQGNTALLEINVTKSVLWI